MRNLLVALFALSVVAWGCGDTSSTETTAETKPTEAAGTEPTSGTASGSGVQIHGGAAGAAAPVTGTESLQGGGSGVGSAAKDAARGAAAKAAGGSVGTEGATDGN